MDGPKPIYPEKVLTEKNYLLALEQHATKAKALEQYLKRKRFEFEFGSRKKTRRVEEHALDNKSGIVLKEMENMQRPQITSKAWRAANSRSELDKGKNKLVGDVPYNNNGLLSQDALEVLEDKNGLPKGAKKICFDLEEGVSKNINVGKWLEKAMVANGEEKKKAFEKICESSSKANVDLDEEMLDLSQILSL